MNSEYGAIYIDGGYLNQVLKKQFNDTKIDYLLLCEEICKKLNVGRLRTYYYYCNPIVRAGNKRDAERKAKSDRFFAKLHRLPRFEVKLGKLQDIGGQYRQKMVDVLMSLDIVDMVFDNQIKHAILIAGDSDFVPAIVKAKSYGAIVHVFYHPKAAHNNLLEKADELHEINESFVKRCLFKKSKKP